MNRVLGSIKFGEGGDPIFWHGVDLTVVGIIALKVLVAFVMLLVLTMFMVWFERKVIADMQNRIGPNRAGPWGMLQTLADGIKLFFKEDAMPSTAERRLFRIAPALVVVPAFLTFAIVPLGGIVEIFGHTTRLQIADPHLGVLWLLIMSSISVYGVMLAGWSSGSKYPLLGSVRASAQMISYEAAIGLAIAAVVLVTGALETSQIVRAQMEPLSANWPSWLHAWNVAKLAVVPFVIFFIAVTAEMNRPPFDLVEAEQELVSGFNTEYSGIRFGMFYVAEFMNTVTMSTVIVTLFLGGGDGPTFGLPSWLMYLAWFAFKSFLVMYSYVWIRGTLPRLRYDQLMNFGWKRLMPIGLGWLLLVAAAQLKTAYTAFVFGACCVFGVILAIASEVGRERAELDDNKLDDNNNSLDVAFESNSAASLDGTVTLQGRQ